MNERICNLISTLFFFLFLLIFIVYFLFLSLFSDFHFLFILSFLITLFYLLNTNCNSTFATLRQEGTCKESSDETDNIIIIFSAEINLLWRLNRVWVSIKLYCIYIYIYIYICVCVCVCVCVWKHDLTNNPQGLICHKIQPNKNILKDLRNYIKILI